MSRFFSENLSALVPYTPGEQPQDRAYIKLNTNESPFPPSPLAQQMAREAAAGLNLYSDPTCAALTGVAAEKLGIRREQLLFTNGSDEALFFAFMAFCSDPVPAVFPDITYSLYPVLAGLCRVPYREFPLGSDLTVSPEDCMSAKGTLFLANPNAPTGIALPLSAVEAIVSADPDRVVVVDEAYVDFGGESALSLIDRYDNLLVIRTFSKSRSLAGARLGFAAGSVSLITDMNTVKYSLNPYNVNSMTLAAGIGALADTEYFEACRQTVIENRAYTSAALRELGFSVPESSANFVFASHPDVSGLTLYRKLKEKGILVRHFQAPRLKEYNRISIGTRSDMETLIAAVREILRPEPMPAPDPGISFEISPGARRACVKRTTAETDIALTLSLDGNGKSRIDTGCGFMDHMLTLFASHGRFDLDVTCRGDTEVDYHHTVEDIGIALGTAFASALGDKRGIRRYGSCTLSMDEALVLTAVDFSGREQLMFSLPIPTQKVGDFDTELVEEFFLGFIRKASCALHVRLFSGRNSHHIIEGAFKSFGRSLREAVSLDPAYADEIPSTKGVL